MNCSICGKPVELYPSAAWRAKHYSGGMSAADYTALFPAHADCLLARRAAETRETIAKYYPKSKYPIPGVVITHVHTSN